MRRTVKDTIVSKIVIEDPETCELEDLSILPNLPYLGFNSHAPE